MTVGKFVLVNTYLMQLYQPLNFPRLRLQREIKQGLVDMEQMFRLLAWTRKSGPAAARRRC
jgi:ABC-type transport system involved in Fe-S cluster assembly fused permease/ATPase subunit